VPVADVDVEAVFRCAFRLEQVAQDVDTAAARTARCFPEGWHGDAGIAYQQRLDATADRVRRMSAAYAAAGAALMPYARALLEAQEMWRRSESLLAEADAAERRGSVAAAAAGVPRLAGPGPEEGFRAAAYQLQADAADLEHRVAAVCAAALDDEAHRAPATRDWRSVDRFLGDVAVTGVGVFTGVASLLGVGWRSLPGVGGHDSRHEARHEFVESATAALSVWNIPIDMRRALEDDRSGLAFGELLSVVGPGRLSKFGNGNLIHDVRLAHLEAFREADLIAEQAGHVIWRQSAVEMGERGVDLRNEEARGGHVRLRHVTAEDEYLFARNTSGIRYAGSFEDLPTAQRFVNEVLRTNAGRLHEVYDLKGRGALRIEARFDEPTGRVAVAGSPRTVVAYGVRVVLKLEGGEPYVYTAFPQL
jgi:hypothetical protein